MERVLEQAVLRLLVPPVEGSYRGVGKSCVRHCQGRVSGESRAEDEGGGRERRGGVGKSCVRHCQGRLGGGGGGEEELAQASLDIVRV